MPGRDIIVVGASAGGVEALATLARGLPADFPAAMFVVLHVPPHGTSVLPKIISRAGRLPATHAWDGESIRPGRIYVAPPDRHLLLKLGHVRVVRGPTENSHRPAIDPLFRTAARCFGRRVIGVVLSGLLDDGTAGLLAIKERGGIAVVQHPDDALFPSMPRSALDNVDVDHAVPIAELAALLLRLATEPLPKTPQPAATAEMHAEADVAELELEALQDPRRPGAPSGFGCPACGGSLWELRDGELIRYRCRVGHAWSPDSLLAEQSGAVETALWSALRALEERAALANNMSARSAQRGHDSIARRFADQARECEADARLIREVLLTKRAENTESTAPESDVQLSAGRPPVVPPAKA
jgi:two-component system chemotaxis response regulator CheB